MGQRTAAAIRRFQKSAGLPEDGKPGQALLERLRAAPAPR
jgi:peptidoglycan hydrolase-like protein with peptidoglycan-binding domain